MGLATSKLYERVADLLSFTTKTRVLLLGLDAAGKTTLLYKLKLNELLTTIPTIGFNVERLRYKNMEMTIWDVGGQDKIRRLWRFYFQNTDALIFTVDSNDEDRVREARDELHQILAEDELRDATVLVFANKQDLPHALSSDKLVHLLGLRALRQNWYIQPCTAVSGSGLHEGLEWLHRALRAKGRDAPTAAAA